MGICIIICAVYLVSLFMAGNPGKLLRKVMTTLLVVYILYGVFLRSNKFGYQIILIGLIALSVMGIVRFVINTAAEMRQNRLNAKLEQKALAMAEGRRGSFKSNAGGVNKYSLEPDPADANLSREEIQDSIENQIRAAKAKVSRDENTEMEEVKASPEKHEAPVTSSWMSASIYADSENSEQPLDSVGTALDYDTIDDDAIPEGAFYARPRFDAPPAYAVPEESYTNAQIMPPAEQIEAIYDALNKLGELRDMGILTEAEFTQKKQELLAKLG
jgi:hypothetical protein